MDGVSRHIEDLRGIGPQQDRRSGLMQGAEQRAAYGDEGLGHAVGDLSPKARQTVLPLLLGGFRNPAHGRARQQCLDIAGGPVFEQTLGGYIGDAGGAGAFGQGRDTGWIHAGNQLDGEQAGRCPMQRMIGGNQGLAVAVEMVDAALARGQHAIETHGDRNVAGVVDAECLGGVGDGSESFGPQPGMQFEQIITRFGLGANLVCGRLR